MDSRRVSKRLLALTLAGSLALNATSCGTLLHPERRGQPPGGPLDPGVVILDAIGRLFFVVPGLIAFAVDFSTGAIYLPPAYYGPAVRRTLKRDELVQVKVDKEELTREKIEEVVRRHSGRPVTLEPGRYRAQPIHNLDEITGRAASDGGPGAAVPPAQVRFKSLPADSVAGGNAAP